MKRVQYKTKAVRQIKKIKEISIKKEITAKVRQLLTYPNVEFKITRYKTTDLLKFRVKNWRIFFTAKLEIVEIKEVKKRNERTYK